MSANTRGLRLLCKQLRDPSGGTQLRKHHRNTLPNLRDGCWGNNARGASRRCTCARAYTQALPPSEVRRRRHRPAASGWTGCQRLHGELL